MRDTVPSPTLGCEPLSQPGDWAPHRLVDGHELGSVVPAGPTNRYHLVVMKPLSDLATPPTSPDSTDLLASFISVCTTHSSPAGGFVGTEKCKCELDKFYNHMEIYFLAFYCCLLFFIVVII